MESQREDNKKQHALAADRKCMKKHSDGPSYITKDLLSALSGMERCGSRFERAFVKAQSDLLHDEKELNIMLKFLEVQISQVLKCGPAIRMRQRNQSHTLRGKKELHARLETIENHLHEVLRSIRTLQNRQEVADIQNAPTELQLARKKTSDESASEAKRRSNSTDVDYVIPRAFTFVLREQEPLHEKLLVLKHPPSTSNVPQQNQLATQPPVLQHNAGLQPELQYMQRSPHCENLTQASISLTRKLSSAHISPQQPHHGRAESLPSVTPLHNYATYEDIDFHERAQRRSAGRLVPSMQSQQENNEKQLAITEDKKYIQRHCDDPSSITEGLLSALSSMERDGSFFERAFVKAQSDLSHDQKELDVTLKFLEVQICQVLKCGPAIRMRQRNQSHTLRGKKELHARLETIENHLHEVLRSIRTLQNRQEVADIQNAPTELQLARKKTSDESASEAKRRSNSTDVDYVIPRAFTFVLREQEPLHEKLLVLKHPPSTSNVPQQNQLATQPPVLQHNAGLQPELQSMQRMPHQVEIDM